MDLLTHEALREFTNTSEFEHWYIGVHQCHRQQYSLEFYMTASGYTMSFYMNRGYGPKKYAEFESKEKILEWVRNLNKQITIQYVHNI